MDFLTLGYVGILVLSGFLIASAALLAVSRIFRNRTASAPITTPEVAFLFEGDTLVDATASARRLLDFCPGLGNDMDRLAAFLSQRFPDLARRVTACGENGTVHLLSPLSDAKLTLRSRGGRLNVTLQDLTEGSLAMPETFGLSALTDALQAIRQTADACPVPIWRQDTDGCVTWANETYLRLARDMAGPKADKDCIFIGLDVAAAESGGAQRLAVTLPGETYPHWFDCHVVRRDREVTVTALPADRIVTAERDLRDFVQTLTRTFAHLSVGLAIFDRSRVLTIFNPALTDLLGLSPEFLIAHPTLAQVLDRLRDRRMIPEPKNYKSWRSHMHTLERAAADGTFSETWPMPDGRMIRVTGRPHPDGALAFLFEDISAEITETRRFRETMEIRQAVLDGLDEAIAVFSPEGRLTLANRSYAELWDIARTDVASDETFLDATRRWQERCSPTPVWGDARDFASAIDERSTWTAEVLLCDGRSLACRFVPLPGGATLAAFLPANAPAKLQRPRALSSVGA
ncbi:MAG: PAS-domain containing protein [Rhodobacter sp.]|nr:PAS-domain containing protein [Rhodobacter sp.]